MSAIARLPHMYNQWLTRALTAAIVLCQIPVHAQMVDPSPAALRPTDSSRAATAQTAPEASPNRERTRILLGRVRQAAPTPALPAAEAKSPAPVLNRHEPYLSDLDAILSASAQPCELHLCFAGSPELTDVQIAQGAAATQALALRAGYRPLIVSHGPDPEPGKFNVLIGTVEQLRAYFTDQEAKRITKAYLGLQPLRAPGADRKQADGYVLVVAGRTPEDIDNAVLSLGMIRVRFPDTATTLIREVVLPENASFFRQTPLEPEKVLSFAQLRDRGSTFAAEPGGVSFDLFFPGYLRNDNTAEVKLNLHYFLRARAFRSTGALKVQLNGHDLEARETVASSSASGGTESSFVFPVRELDYGRNVLQITTVSAEAQPLGKDLRIYSDSALALPKLETGPKLPDLRLTSRTFYPFIGQPDGSDLAVLLAGREAETIDAAWTFLCRLAQSANTFFYAAQLTSGEIQPRRHVVAIGTYDHLPAPFRGLVALRAFDETRRNVPLTKVDNLSSGINLKGLIERVLDKHWKRVITHREEDKPADLAGVSDFDRDYGILATAPPAMPDQGWNLVLTAFTQQNLLHRVQSLVRPAFWDQLNGDIVRWKDEPSSFQARVPGEVRQTVQVRRVELPLGERLDFRIWVALVMGILFLFVIITVRVLSKFEALVLRRRRSQ